MILSTLIRVFIIYASNSRMRDIADKAGHMPYMGRYFHRVGVSFYKIRR